MATKRRLGRLETVITTRESYEETKLHNPEIPQQIQLARIAESERGDALALDLYEEIAKYMGQ
jgi:hypothetical protein